MTNNTQTLTLSAIEFNGHDLVRPECVLACKSGNLYVSDFRGGVTQISPDGRCTFFGGSEVEGFGILKPNGICIDKDANFLIAHLGDTQGGVFKIERNGSISPWLLEIDGKPLPPSNFIYLDHQGRYWLTISTRKMPRAEAYRSDVSDGYIVLIDEDGARIVADDIGYTNEVYVTPDGKTLYVNATFARETIAFNIDDTKSKCELNNRRVVGRFGLGIYPDGLTMDTQGHLWITSIVSNSIVRLNPRTGESALVLQDVDQEHLKWVEQAYLSHSMGRPHLDNVKSTRLDNISSLAFGGVDLSTIHLGCLLGQQVASIQTNYTGLPPSHWELG